MVRFVKTIQKLNQIYLWNTFCDALSIKEFEEERNKCVRCQMKKKEKKEKNNKQYQQFDPLTFELPFFVFHNA
jgi:uncharacterized paraquat-inducible protein A